MVLQAQEAMSDCVGVRVCVKGNALCAFKDRYYSAFRQKFPKLWTSAAHSFLEQIAQNKN